MREAVPAHLPVSVKVRLGWDSGEKKFEIADAVQQAGATELVVHGRTKEQGYRAEHIDWQAIGEIRQRLNIPVIANGEIWDWQSAQQCMAISGCDAVMIGRGALNIPNLSRVVNITNRECRGRRWLLCCKNIPVWKSRAIPGYITLRGLNSG